MTTWRSASTDPNSAEALEYRQGQLDAARYPRLIPDRDEFLLDCCRDRRVLDIGCVGHAVQLDASSWLHGRITTVAGSCVGVDNDADGVDRALAAGYDVVCANASAEAGELFAQAPFDVVVAADVIEHVASPEGLCRFTAEVLESGGRFVVTTPNPFAPWRYFLGTRMRNRDNVDHVALFFPSGIAELADRTGFRLVVSATSGIDDRRTLARRSVGRAYATIRRHRWRGSWRTTPLQLLPTTLSTWTDAQMGETSIYVLEKLG